MKDGQGVESNTIGQESAHGLMNALGSRFSSNRTFVQIGGPGYRLPAQRLRERADANPVLRDLMVRHAQSVSVHIEQSVACNAQHHVDARLCRWLLMSQDRTGNSHLPLTQEFLGLMLGVHRTSVTIAARALQSAGLIRYSRGNIEILDRSGLEDGACECYAVAKQKAGRILDRS